MLKKFDIKGKNNESGIGYVIIARDVDRTAFVEMCYRTVTVFLLMLDGRAFEKAKVSENIMSHLEFPDEPLALGSSVVWVMDKLTGFPMVVGVLADKNKMGDLIEHSYKLGRDVGSNSSSVSGNSADGLLILDVVAAGGGEIRIRSDNLIKLKSVNLIDVFAKDLQIHALKSIKNRVQSAGEEDKMECGYELGDGYSYKDEFKNEVTATDGGYKVSAKDGLTVKELLDDIVTEISNITVATALGTQAILNKVQVEDLKQKIKKIFK